MCSACVQVAVLVRECGCVRGCGCVCTWTYMPYGHIHARGSKCPACARIRSAEGQNYLAAMAATCLRARNYLALMATPRLRARRYLALMAALRLRLLRPAVVMPTASRAEFRNKAAALVLSKTVKAAAVP